MAVEVNVDRQAIELTYDDTEVQGDTINVRAENDETGDISTRDELKNDGRFVWTAPSSFKGKTRFTVAGVDGGTDSGIVDWADFSATTVEDDEDAEPGTSNE